MTYTKRIISEYGNPKKSGMYLTNLGEKHYNGLDWIGEGKPHFVFPLYWLEPTTLSEPSGKTIEGNYVFNRNNYPSSIGLIIHFTVERKDGKNIVEGWDFFQEIKNKEFGEKAQMVEVFPKQIEVVNYANIRHFWILPDSYEIPFTTDSKATPPVTSEVTEKDFENLIDAHLTPTEMAKDCYSLHLSALSKAKEKEAVAFAEWVEDNGWKVVYSYELKIRAWIDTSKVEVLVHGSDYHFTELITKHGKNLSELYTLYTNKTEAK